jgi:hypothetical protein
MSENLPAARAAAPLHLNSLAEYVALGDVLAASGYFADARSAAQAVVRMLVGRELGFGPLASMTGVHIIEGKPSAGSHLLAAAIRGSNRYDYRVVEHTDKVCALQFSRRNGDGTWVDLQPVEKLTMIDATARGMHLTIGGKLKPAWQKAPKNMLFARCISNGYRFHCPDLLSGCVVYDPDELDATPAKDRVEVLPPVQIPQKTSEPGDVLDPEFTVIPATGEPEGNASAPEVKTAPAADDEALTEAELAELSAAFRSYGRSVTDMEKILGAAQIRTLQQLPRTKFAWAMAQLSNGPVSFQQIDRISNLIQGLKLPWDRVRTRLQGKYGVTSLAHLDRSQASEVEASLQKAAQPTTVMVPTQGDPK